jgi:CRISPR/Cas system-associated exonuclease Cas4 (RecB family)
LTETPTTTVDVKAYRSVSQLTSWLSCGEAYRLERFAKAPQRPAAWFAQGIAFHEAIEFWEKHDRKPALEDALEVYETAWDREEAAAHEKGWAWNQWTTGTPKRDGKADVAIRRPKGMDQVSDYMEYALLNAEEWRILTLPNGEKALEQRFEMDLGIPGNLVRVVGYIDQMVEYRNGAIRPRDLKTGTKRPEWEVQLGVYALAMRDCFGIQDVWHGDYYMAKDRGVTKPYDLAKFTRETVTDWFHTLQTAVEHEVFMPNPGSMCNVCSVWEWCSAKGPNAGAY